MKTVVIVVFLGFDSSLVFFQERWVKYFKHHFSCRTSTTNFPLMCANETMLVRCGSFSKRRLLYLVFFNPPKAAGQNGLSFSNDE